MITYDDSSSSEGTIELRDIETWQLLCKFEKVESFLSLSFSPDGNKLAASGMPGTAQVWDATSCKRLYTISGHEGYVDLAFNPDGHTLVAAGYKTVWLWDLSTKTLSATLETAGNKISSIAISPDGKVVAISELAGFDSPSEIKLWDANSGRLLVTLAGHTD